MRTKDEFVELAADAMDAGGKMGMFAALIVSLLLPNETQEEIEQERHARVIAEKIDSMSIIREQRTRS
jgi:hypothetical protein